MAKCSNCGDPIGLFADSVAHDNKLYCSECGVVFQDVQATELELIEFEAKIDAIMLTTETAPNLNIIKRIEIVTAETAFGMNVFKDLFASVRNIVGGRSKAVQQTMRDARKTALYELKVEAHLVGANAVVGVDLDYVELSSSGSMVMLVASGTAVIIED
jgi:uncharacterized protein YbjQ (UPF0145 family)